MASSRGFAGDLVFWILIIAIAALSVFFFVVQPKTLLLESINPVVLDAGSIRDIAFERMSDYEFPYGDESGYGEDAKYFDIVDLESINSNNFLVMPDKVMSCKVTVTENNEIVKALYCGSERGESRYETAVTLPYAYRFSFDTRYFKAPDEGGFADYLVTVSVVTKGEGYDS